MPMDKMTLGLTYFDQFICIIIIFWCVINHVALLFMINNFVTKNHDPH